MRTISYGGGVQSTAMVVLATQGKIDADVALFANTGDDSENPETLTYVRDVLMPWARERGVTVHELRKTYASGAEHPTLYEYLTRTNGIPIPVRLQSGAPASRTCTVKWKADVLAKWRKDNGATEDNPAIAYVGFSTDEFQRANKKKGAAWERIAYPLLDLGLSRLDCENVIRAVGLPVPPKSACWFCPWTPIRRWREIKRDDPARFEDAVRLEQVLSLRSQFRGHGPVYLTDALVPLHRVAGEDTEVQLGCDEGFCWT